MVACKILLLAQNVSISGIVIVALLVLVVLTYSIAYYTQFVMKCCIVVVKWKPHIHIK